MNENQKMTNPDNVTKILKERHPDLFQDELTVKVSNIENTLNQLVKDNAELRKQLSEKTKTNNNEKEEK